MNPGNLRRTCVHLGDQDREAIETIQEQMDLSSGALAVRFALRSLAKALTDKTRFGEPKKPETDGT